MLKEIKNSGLIQVWVIAYKPALTKLISLDIKGMEYANISAKHETSLSVLDQQKYVKQKLPEIISGSFCLGLA
jgi:hypothetical protein